jgi:hypothetical protein
MRCMTTRYSTYTTEDAARRAVETLRATGVAGHDIRLITGGRVGDLRQEPAGGFAGPVAPDAPVGTYGGTTVQRRQGAGAFAGDPDRQRQGSFGDADRVLLVTYDDGGERTRIIGLRGVRRLLRRAALDDERVDRTTRLIHMGRSVVLVCADDDTTAERFDQVVRAA